MTLTIQENIKEAFEKLGDKVPQQMRQSIENVVIKMYENDLSPMKAMGINPAQSEMLYEYGYKLFKSGQYKNALSVFYFLRQLDFDSFRYNFAIAACYQHLNEYTNAIANYLICTHIDFQNPLPYYHIYDCYLKQNQLIPALQGIVSVLITIKNKPEYAKLKEKALIEYRGLKKLIRESLKDESKEQIHNSQEDSL